MKDTLPPETERRIRIATDLVLHKADDDRQFREEMLKTVTKMDVKLDHITERMLDHEMEDERRFSSVNQSIGGALTLKQIGWTLAGVTATVATFWGIIELVSRIKT